MHGRAIDGALEELARATLLKLEEWSADPEPALARIFEGLGLAEPPPAEAARAERDAARESGALSRKGSGDSVVWRAFAGGFGRSRANSVRRRSSARKHVGPAP